MLIVMTVIAILLGNHMRKVQKQRRVVAWVLKQGGQVSYRDPFGPFGWGDIVWANNRSEPEFLGEDFFNSVKCVDLSNTNVSDLSPLTSLKGLYYIGLDDQVTAEERIKLRAALPDCIIPIKDFYSSEE